MLLGWRNKSFFAPGKARMRWNLLMLVGKLFQDLCLMFTCHSARLTLRPEDLRAAIRPELPYIYRYIEIAVESSQLLVLELPYSFTVADI